jgi:hypothetical protein
MKTKQKKISAHLPRKLLEEACRIGKVNETDALIMGRRALIADLKRRSLVEAAGEFHFSFDTDAFRERNRL